jgi:dihydrofolate reductase
LLKGDVPTAVAELKAQPVKDLVILGSGVLIQTLMKHNLTDTYILLIHPLVLGSGRRLFESGASTTLQLVDVKSSSTGVVIATYRPKDEKGA